MKPLHPTSFFNQKYPKRVSIMRRQRGLALLVRGFPHLLLAKIIMLAPLCRNSKFKYISKLIKSFHLDHQLVNCYLMRRTYQIKVRLFWSNGHGSSLLAKRESDVGGGGVHALHALICICIGRYGVKATTQRS